MIIAVSVITLIVQISFWFIIFKRLTVCDTPNSEKVVQKSSLSIIICAKNEFYSLRSQLAQLLNQKHPDLKVLLVDDFSADQTAEYIRNHQHFGGRLLYHKVTKNTSGKKQAVAEGIVKAETEFILFTDADCIPASDKWATKMHSKSLTSKKDIILGYSPYQTNGQFLQQWIHFENWMIGVMYLSFCKLGLPYMGVGRNLLYKKGILKPEYLKQHNDLVSGDDDLTINQIANRSNTEISIDPDTFVWTSSLNSWIQYWHQKRRHYSSANRYKRIHKILLALFPFSQVVFFLACTLLSCIQSIYWALFLYGLRLILIYPIAHQLSKKLHSKIPITLYWFYDICLTVFYMIFSFAFLFPKKDQW